MSDRTLVIPAELLRCHAWPSWRPSSDARDAANAVLRDAEIVKPGTIAQLRAELAGDGERCDECGMFIPAGEGGHRLHAEACGIGTALDATRAAA